MKSLLNMAPIPSPMFSLRQFMRMKYRLAIFDFDGTLADSFPFFSLLPVRRSDWGPLYSTSKVTSMTTSAKCFSLVLLLAASLTVAAPAQDKKAAASRAPTTGFRADLLRQLDEVGQQLLSLAEATPSEKYAWRPAEGVRSVAEVYAHVAAANFYAP